MFSNPDIKLMWVTNNSGGNNNPDPIRITDGTTWVDFTPPNYGQIDATTFLVQCLAMLPFRGRMVTFNTYEGPTLNGAINYSNRLRWSAIGNPFIPFSAGPPAAGSWRSDIRGQGGFLDIPTSEAIVAVGYVRDNLVIYCERSTWQLRYTGRSIAPFQIERVNSELGAESLFSAIQFDTSLLGIGDKGIVKCDSYKSDRIDIKIPDFVFGLQSANNGAVRVQGMRDFINRLAYWALPLASVYDPAVNGIFPNQRLVYNYDNDSWALFDDSFTALGEYQIQSGRNWLNTKIPWVDANFSWIQQPLESPQLAGGNQQGFVEILDQQSLNDESLYISNITANTTTPTVIEVKNHNLVTGFVIKISGIPSTDPFTGLNNNVYGVIVVDKDNLKLMVYDSVTGQFSTPQLDTPGDDYLGAGVLSVRDNFNIISKKFNFLDQGQSIQLGYLDILTKSTESNNEGSFSLNVYLNYDDNSAINTLPQNVVEDGLSTQVPDTFFNSVIPLKQSTLSGVGGSKFWHRAYCPTRGNFLTLEYTFNNEQMAGDDCSNDVQIDAQILWIREAGRLTSI